jgi:hypothetical protein
LKHLVATKNLPEHLPATETVSKYLIATRVILDHRPSIAPDQEDLSASESPHHYLPIIKQNGKLHRSRSTSSNKFSTPIAPHGKNLKFHNPAEHIVNHNNATQRKVPPTIIETRSAVITARSPTKRLSCGSPKLCPAINIGLECGGERTFR